VHLYEEVMFTIRPVAAALVAFSALVESALYYAQYRYDVFPDEVKTTLEKIEPLNFKGLGKLIYDVAGRVVLAVAFICGMYSGVSFRDAGLVNFSLLYFYWVASLTFRVLGPHFQNHEA
jgi:hypothetical protein